MGMEYWKIHVCLNDCILYRKELERLRKCPRCGVSRYKVKDDDSDEDDIKKGPPTKVLWYLPIIPQLRPFFANIKDVKNLTWHANERKCDGYYDILSIHHNLGVLPRPKVSILVPATLDKCESNSRVGYAFPLHV